MAAVLTFAVIIQPGDARAQLGVANDPICRLRNLPDGAAVPGKLEYDVKAAVLYRCLELVQWPATNSSPSSGQLTIGILGKNRFGDSLDFLTSKSIGGRRVSVTKVSKASRAVHCQLVFISESEEKRTAKILDSLAMRPVLTISEVPGFTQRGGMINLLLLGKNIRLEVNPAAAEKAGLVLDPKLIKLAEGLEAPARSPNTAPVASNPNG